MSKRVHELAREWDIAPKELLLAAEKLGIRGKRSQSSFTDEEVQRVRDILSPHARPEVSIGTERVVSERVVTERDNSVGDAVVTAREQTTETRLRAGMIRRRTAREVLKREELPPASFVPDEENDIPPALDLDEIAPPLPDAPAPSPEPAVEDAVAAAPARSAAEAPAAEAPAVEVPRPAPIPVRPPPTGPLHRESAARSAAPPPIPR